MLKANYHTHSTLCDGTSTIREYVEQAVKIGFAHIGFSGHMDADVHMDFEKYLIEIEEVKKQYQDSIEVLCGIELDNLYDPKYAQMVDYVIGSTHFLDVKYERPLSIDNTPEDVVLLCNEFYNGDYYKMCKEYFELEATIWSKFPCSVIGHFDIITKFNNILHFVDEEDPRYLSSAFDAMRVLTEKDIPFELNTRQSNRGKFFPNKILLQGLHEFGGEIIISSDAHQCAELNHGFDCAVQLAKEVGFDHTNYLSKANDGVKMIQIGI